MMDPNPAMERGKEHGNQAGQTIEEEALITYQGIGAPSRQRREGAKGGLRLHGLGPWSGEGMALPVQEKTPFPGEPER